MWASKKVVPVVWAWKAVSKEGQAPSMSTARQGQSSVSLMTRRCQGWEELGKLKEDARHAMSQKKP